LFTFEKGHVNHNIVLFLPFDINMIYFTS